MLVLVLVLGLLPGFAWLVFYLDEEDPHPEPKRLIALTFFAGIAFGFFTIAIEELFNNFTAQIGIEVLSVASLFGLALIEELMKFGAAYFAAGKSPQMGQPIDRMIYLVVAALGFATLENLGAVANLATTSTSIVMTILQTDSLRFVGATLLHSLASAIVGYHWALGVAQKKVVQNLAVGFLLAASLHAFFNYLILNYGNIIYTILLLVVVGFFVLNDFEKLKAESV